MTHIVKTLVYLYFVFFPLGLIFRYKLSDNVFITPLDIVTGLLFMTVLLNFRKTVSFIEKSKFVTFQLLFVAIGTASLLINWYIHSDLNLVNSLLYSIRYIAVLSLFVVGNTYEGKINIRKAILISSVLFLAFGFAQYIFFYDLRPFTYLGWDNHLYRLFSTLFDPNFAGIFYAMLSIFFVKYAIDLKFSKSILPVLLSFFSGIALFATYSRSALTSALIGVLAVMLLKHYYKMIFFFVLSVFGFVVIFADTSIEGLNPFRRVSVDNRIITAKQAIEVALESPVMGVGFNAYRDAQVRIGLKNPIGTLLSNADAGTDNSILFAFVTAGIAGGLFFLLSYIYLLNSLFMEKDSGYVFFGVVMAALVGSFFVNVLFFVPIMSWVFLVLGFRSRIR